MEKLAGTQLEASFLLASFIMLEDDMPATGGEM